MPRVLEAAHQALSPLERRFVVGCAALLIIGAIWGGTPLILSRTEAIPREGGVYREGMVGQPRYIAPMLARTNDVDMALSRVLYSGLLKLTSENTLEGDLAESVDASEDGKVYTAHLREGITWHDGEPVTADDVVFTVQTIQNPDTKSPSAPSFQGVTVEKVDDRTATFTLREPYAPFPYNLTIGIAPQHIWATVEPQNIALAEQNLKPIGTGPFQFKKLRKRSLGEILEVELRRYDDYHGQRPFLDGITFTFFQSTEDLVRAFQRRTVDGMSFVSPSLVPEIERIRHGTLHRVKLPQYFAVFFNQARNQTLSDRTVRTALDLATDRETLIREALRGEGMRADAPIPTGFLGRGAHIRNAEFSVEKAKQNLEEAGWKDTDGDGIREKGGTKLSLTLVTTDWPEYVTTAELLAASWRSIGAEVGVESKTVGTVQTEIIRPRNYDALLYGEVLGADPDPYPFWHSTQTRDPGLNLALYKDREADKLLEEARKTMDIERRRATYEKFQERLLEELPAIFLYSPLYTYAVQPSVRGTMFEALPLPSERFTTVSSWYMRTKRIWKHEGVPSR
jgi:peptide/nickel transport system substrate-binding protein